MSETFDPETLKVGDRVSHTDRPGNAGELVRFQGYPLVTVRWDSTGAESTENMYYLVPAAPAEDAPSITLEHVSSWMRDPDAYDPSKRIRWFEVNGKRYTAHSVHSDAPDAWPITVREAITGKYVQTVSSWRRLPEQLAPYLA